MKANSIGIPMPRRMRLGRPKARLTPRCQPRKQTCCMSFAQYPICHVACITAFNMSSRRQSIAQQMAISSQVQGYWVSQHPIMTLPVTQASVLMQCKGQAVVALMHVCQGNNTVPMAESSQRLDASDHWDTKRMGQKQVSRTVNLQRSCIRPLDSLPLAHSFYDTFGVWNDGHAMHCKASRLDQYCLRLHTFPMLY